MRVILGNYGNGKPLRCPYMDNIGENDFQKMLMTIV